MFETYRTNTGVAAILNPPVPMTSVAMKCVGSPLNSEGVGIVGNFIIRKVDSMDL